MELILCIVTIQDKLKVQVKSKQQVDFFIEHRECGIVLLNEGHMLQTEEEIDQLLLPLKKVGTSLFSIINILVKFTHPLVLLYLSPLTSSAYADIQLNIVLRHGTHLFF